MNLFNMASFSLVEIENLLLSSWLYIDDICIPNDVAREGFKLTNVKRHYTIIHCSSDIRKEYIHT